MHFMDVKKSVKLSSFVMSLCFKDSAFTAVKRGSNFVGERVTGVLFCQKWYIKGSGVGPRGGVSPL